MNRFRKQPNETFPIALDWYGRMPVGTTITSFSAASVRLPDDVTDPTVIGSSNISGKQCRIYVQGGMSGKRYKLTVRANLSDGSVLEEDIEMEVEET